MECMPHLYMNPLHLVSFRKDVPVQYSTTVVPTGAKVGHPGPVDRRRCPVRLPSLDDGWCALGLAAFAPCRDDGLQGGPDGVSASREK